MREKIDAALKFVTTASLGAILGAAALWRLQYGPPYVSGTATVIDGDNLKVAGQNVRLMGIDAPELPERGGQQCNKLLSRPECIERSAVALHWKVGGEEVRCWITGNDALSAFDKWNRPLGVCFHDDTELNAWMLRACHVSLPEELDYHVWRYYPVVDERICAVGEAPVASREAR